GRVAAATAEEAQAPPEGHHRAPARPADPRHHRVIALIQRVREARVQVDGLTTGAIHRGIVALVGVERGDEEAQAVRLVERVIGYRIFADAQGKMNRSLAEVGGGLLLVPQFTLAADTTSGARPRSEERRVGKECRSR